MGSSTVQGEFWGAAATDWAKLQEPKGRPLWEGMLAAANVRTPTRFFDAGCGAGGASALAAQRGAGVTGLDASPALLAIARQRVPDGEFRVGDLEDLPYDNDSFDVTFAANSVMFATDPSLAIRELARVTAPDGRVAVGIWGTPEDCEMRHIFKALVDTLPAPPRGEGPFALSGHGVLEGLFTQAALKVLTSGGADCPFEYADSQAAWRAISSAGPSQAAMQSVTETELKTAVQTAIKPFQDSQGRIRLENRFRYVIGTR